VILVVGLLAPVAGVGLLYLLRDAGIAGVGPSPSGALPLEQLAGADAQPLLRMALAWIPVGLAAGALLVAFTRSSRARTTVAMAVVSGLMLVVSAAASDALANNEPFSNDTSAPLRAGGTWVSLALLIIGAAIGGALAAKLLPAPSGD
jgi:hypothetical protein